MSAPPDDDPPAGDESSVFDEQNFAGYLLIVGSVTAVFVAAFTFLLSGAVSQVLIAITITLGFLSIIIGFALNVLGHFEEQPTTAPVEEPATTTRRAWKPDTPVNKPLPPLINFDTELRQLEEHFDGDLPEQMDSFVDEYKQLRTTNSIDKRRSIASSMRSALNPVPVLVESAEMEQVVDEMGDRLFRYIRADATEHLTVSDAAFYRDGERRPVAELQGGEARVKATVHNAGEASTAEVEIEFRNKDGIKVKSTSLPVGRLPPNARKDLNTRVYIPSLATDATIYAVASAQDDEVLEM
ncbi:hypothetical protein [Halosegnis sp.]|uniref:hypothetical protein n=1 Tax=Halosegnis sp. TaxID=2864959 RepID=UPI0035D49559